MQSILRAYLRAAAAVVAAGLATAWTGVALGRPGGGGGYHGGGHGGGGFHGVSHGVGGAVSASGGGPVSFVVFLFLAILLFVVVAQLRKKALDLAGDDPPGPGGAGSAPRADPLAPLRARDPGLTAESVVDHVRQMADALRGAWCAGDMGPARAFVSDGIFTRYRVQLGLMQAENRRNVMSDARVLSVAVEAVEDAPPLDVVHVRVTAEARDTEVPWSAPADAVRAALERAPIEPYTEIWSIARCAGATSKPAGYAVGRACPRCGAPLAEGETMKCRYCGALVCSGEHDWVLSEITQLVEWRPASRPAAGLDALRARDPGIAREVIEDRASYLFWKWVQAGRAGQLAPLRKCAAPAFLAAGARLEWPRGASEVAVGSADLVSCEVAADGQGFDRVYVEVAWSARFGGASAFTPSRAVLRLARRSGVVSRPSMTSLACARCGAPLVESDSPRCDHCGAELADGEQAFVLEAVLAPGEPG